MSYEQTFKVWLDEENSTISFSNNKKRYTCEKKHRFICWNVCENMSAQYYHHTQHKKVAVKYVRFSVAPTKLSNPIKLFILSMNTEHSKPIEGTGDFCVTL